MTDIHELEKGMDLVRKEAELRGSGKERGSGQSVVLRDFLANSEEKLRRLKADGRTAQDAFRECVEYFGESPRTADASTFFSLLVRFARAFKVSSYIILDSGFHALSKFTYYFLNPECFSRKYKLNKFKGVPFRSLSPPLPLTPPSTNYVSLIYCRTKSISMSCWQDTGWKCINLPNFLLFSAKML